MKQGKIVHWYPDSCIFAEVDGEQVYFDIKGLAAVNDAEFRTLRYKLKQRNREYGRASATISQLRNEIARLRAEKGASS